VIIILAGAVIMSLSQNNAILQATEAKFKYSISEYNSELSIYLADKYTSSAQIFNPDSLHAITPSEVKNIIKSMTDVDAQKFKIIQGKLVTTSTASLKETAWATQVGVLQQEYFKNDLISYIDGYDAPQNIAGTYYWMDKSQNNNNVIMYNFNNPSSSTTSGYDSASKSYVFDGVDDYMTSTSNIYSIKNEFTFEIVFKPTTYRYITINACGIDLKWREPGQNPYMNYWDTLGNYNSTSFNNIPTLNSIYTFSTTFNNTERQLFINGQQYNSVTQSLTLNSAQKLVIGSGSERVIGNIYSIRIYNRALTTQEVKYNYSLDLQRFGAI